jgi:uncharacterized ion transporter superfamily protein YfcC
VWVIATAITAGFMMWYAARIKRRPEVSRSYLIEQE